MGLRLRCEAVQSRLAPFFKFGGCQIRILGYVGDAKKGRIMYIMSQTHFYIPSLSGVIDGTQKYSVPVPVKGENFLFFSLSARHATMRLLDKKS